jgi:urease accessory protein
MLQMISKPVSEVNPALPEVAVRVERLKLAKRLWRGAADDGVEFGCELERPLTHGDTIWQSGAARYVVRQTEEAVLEISLHVAASAAAGIGWAVGNLHLELMGEAGRLLTPDDKAARQLFERIHVEFRETTAVFRPGRFARGEAVIEKVAVSEKVDAVAENAIVEAVELGRSHRH